MTLADNDKDSMEDYDKSSHSKDDSQFTAKRLQADRLKDTQQYARWFRHSAPYINQHRGKTFVLMLTGEALAHENLSTLINDLAVLNSLGVKLALCFGAQAQIDSRLNTLGMTSAYFQHWRITTPELMSVIKEVVGGLGIDLEAKLSLATIDSPMHGSQLQVCRGNFITAKPLGVRKGQDLSYTGQVRRVQHEAIQQQLDAGRIVLLTCLGYSPTGETFNLPIEEVAAEVSTAIKADKLILFSPHQGLLDEDGHLIKDLHPNQGDLWLEKIRQGDISFPLQTLEKGVSAVTQGVKRCHLLSHCHDGALLEELFTREGCGTMMTQENVEVIRPATIEDVAGILNLLNPLEEDGTLVRRSRERLEMEISQFSVLMRYDLVIGCAALYPFPDQSLGELACVAIHREYRGQNRGDRLLKYIEHQAQQQGLSSLFVLTTQTAHWFVERGFQALNLDQLPSEKQRLYNYRRNSLVYSKMMGKQ